MPGSALAGGGATQDVDGDLVWRRSDAQNCLQQHAVATARGSEQPGIHRIDAAPETDRRIGRSMGEALQD